MSFKYNEEQAIKLNKLGVFELKANNLEKSLELLNKALISARLIQKDPQRSRLLSQIFNNFGIFYKKTKNYSTALNYLMKAIDLDDNLAIFDKGYIALAHLNICNILSIELHHHRAISHGLKAISIMETLCKHIPKLRKSLIITYLNLGNEYKFAGDLCKAESVLKTGLKKCGEVLGNNTQMLDLLQSALSIVKHLKTRPYITRPSKYVHFSPVLQPSRLPIVFQNNHSYNLTPKKHKKLAEINSASKTPEKSSRGQHTIRRSIDKPNLYYIKNVRADYRVRSAADCWRALSSQEHRSRERAAAVIIESWWRKVLARRNFIKYGLKKDGMLFLHPKK